MAIAAMKQWQRPDQLKAVGVPLGMSGKFMRKQDVERRLDEGWVIVESAVKTVKEGGPVDKAVHYRSLILMAIPTEMKEQRNKFYQDKHWKRVRATARGGAMSSLRKAATSAGSETEDGRPLAGPIGGGLKIHQGVQTQDGLRHTDDINISVEGNEDDLREDAEVREELAEKKRDAQPEKSSKQNKRR